MGGAVRQACQPKNGLRGSLIGRSRRLPVWAWLIMMVAIGFTLPLLTSNDLVIRIAGNVALMGMLALGLNVVVGFAGLLDLGFVAFYGIGAYAYAYLSSDFTGVHLPTWETLIIITVISALFGLLLGLPSLRLIGDYLAIVTLGFGQIFVQLMTSLTRVKLPGQTNADRPDGRPERDRQPRPAALFRLHRQQRHRLLSDSAGRAGADDAGDLSPAQVAHRARLVGAARGRTRRRSDGDADAPPENSGVRGGRGHRRD